MSESVSLLAGCSHRTPPPVMGGREVGIAPTTPPPPPLSRHLGRPLCRTENRSDGRDHCSSGRLPGGGDAKWGLAAHPKAADAHSRPLQELLLLPVGVHHLLGHQLHQLQALLDLHQDLKVLPAPHLSTGGRPRPRVAGLSPRPPVGASEDPGLTAPWAPQHPQAPPSLLPGGVQVLPVHNHATPSCPSLHPAFPLSSPVPGTLGVQGQRTQQRGDFRTRDSFLSQR